MSQQMVEEGPSTATDADSSGDQVHQLQTQIQALTIENEKLHCKVAKNQGTTLHWEAVREEVRCHEEVCERDHVNCDTGRGLNETEKTAEIERLEAEIKTMEALCGIGRDVRARLIELRKDKAERDHECVKRGNEAAHRGMPLIDLAVARESGSLHEWCTVYGILEKDIEIWTKAPRLLKALEYHGSPKFDDLPFSYSLLFEDRFEKFRDLVKTAIDEEASDTDDDNESLTSVLDLGSIRDAWKEVEEEYERIMKANKEHRARAKEVRRLRQSRAWSSIDEMDEKIYMEEWKEELKRRWTC